MRTNAMQSVLQLLCALAVAAAAPADCSTSQPNTVVKFDPAQKSLICINDPQTSNVLKSLKVNSKHYTTLTCDSGKWRAEDGTEVADSNVELAVTCEDYCKTAGTPAVTVTALALEVTVKCADPTLTLLHGSAATRKVVKDGTLQCTLAKGWTENGVSISADSHTELPTDCKKPCNNIKKYINDDVTAGVEDGKSSDVDGTLGGPFKCKGIPDAPDRKLITREKNGIKLNNAFVESNLYCDAENGWTDFAKTKKLASAFDDVTLSCGKVPCADVPVKICEFFNDNDPFPMGYECEKSPYMLTDNAYQLNCGDEKKILYDATSKAFLGNTLVCKAGNDWYKLGDSEQKSIGDTSFLFCLRRRCNSCAKLPEISGLPASTYVEGTSKECAKATCPENLWKIKIDDATEVEYAGEVTCSSDTATGKKWLIDGKTPIKAGSCVTSVSCSTAAKLETTCAPGWAASGCVELSLNDDNEVACAGGKSMFYMHPGGYAFEEGATSVKCEKDKGVWKVTKSGGEDVLKRGGTVVCADSNPSPPTTTLPPTTPTPLPCTLCPNVNETLKKCETCSDKKEVVFKDYKDTDTCVASVLYVTPSRFQTDKAGLVTGSLICTKPDRIWKTADGKEVGLFAPYVEAKKSEEQEAKLFIIVAGAAGGVIVLFVIFFVIFKVVISKKKPVDPREEERKKRMMEEGKKRMKKRGKNDEILDDLSSQAPSEIKL